MCKSAVQDDVVEIKLARSDSSYSEDVCNFRQVVIPGDDSDLHTMQDQFVDLYIEGTFRSRVRALKRAMLVGMSRGSVRHQPYAVIDPGAEHEVIGGVGWQILHFLTNQSH